MLHGENQYAIFTYILSHHVAVANYVKDKE